MILLSEGHLGERDDLLMRVKILKEDCDWEGMRIYSGGPVMFYFLTWRVVDTLLFITVKVFM